MDSAFVAWHWVQMILSNLVPLKIFTYFVVIPTPARFLSSHIALPCPHFPALPDNHAFPVWIYKLSWLQPNTGTASFGKPMPKPVVPNPIRAVTSF